MEQEQRNLLPVGAVAATSLSTWAGQFLQGILPTLSPLAGTVWACAASQKVEGRRAAALWQLEREIPPAKQLQAPVCGCAVSPTRCHLAQELPGASTLGSRVLLAPSQGGAVILPPLIKMFIELLETLRRQGCKSGVCTRCVELYPGGSRGSSSADGPQRNASHKRRQHPHTGRGCEQQQCRYLEL